MSFSGGDDMKEQPKLSRYTYQLNKLNEIINVVWALRQEGDSIRTIAKTLGVDKGTVNDFLRTEEYLNFDAEHGGSMLAKGLARLVTEHKYDPPDLSR